jgi:hypothetical protein
MLFLNLSILALLAWTVYSCFAAARRARLISAAARARGFEYARTLPRVGLCFAQLSNFQLSRNSRPTFRNIVSFEDPELGACVIADFGIWTRGGRFSTREHQTVFSCGLRGKTLGRMAVLPNHAVARSKAICVHGPFGRTVLALVADGTTQHSVNESFAQSFIGSQSSLTCFEIYDNQVFVYSPGKRFGPGEWDSWKGRAESLIKLIHRR